MKKEQVENRRLNSMAALSLTPTHRAPSSCGICGCDDVDIDYVEDFFAPGEGAAFALGECPRCDHRWTRPLQRPRRREAQNAVTVPLLRAPLDSIPNAA